MTPSDACQVVLSSSATNLKLALEGRASATVEAEYGEVCVEGSVITLAHHGPRSSNPCPCLRPNEKVESVEVIGVSHIDLDTMGGIMSILGMKPESKDFWELAGFMDTYGEHKVSERNADPEVEKQLYAYFAWSDDRKVYPPRDGSIMFVTEQVVCYMRAIRQILNNDPKLIKAGEKFKKDREELARKSFVEVQDRVILRSSDKFTNHLYVHEGEAYDSVVAYDSASRSVTISFADSIPGLSCLVLVQEIFPDKDPDTGEFLSGGQEKVAGGPREIDYSIEDARLAFDKTVSEIRKSRSLIKAPF